MNTAPNLDKRSATEDEYSADADRVLQQAGLQDAVDHVRVAGGHELDSFRFEAIVDWVVTHAQLEQ